MQSFDENFWYIFIYYSLNLVRTHKRNPFVSPPKIETFAGSDVSPTYPMVTSILM